MSGSWALCRGQNVAWESWDLGSGSSWMILGTLLDFLEPLCFQNKPFQRFSALSVGEYTQREDSSNTQHDHCILVDLILEVSICIHGWGCKNIIIKARLFPVCSVVTTRSSIGNNDNDFTPIECLSHWTSISAVPISMLFNGHSLRNALKMPSYSAFMTIVNNFDSPGNLTFSI